MELGFFAAVGNERLNDQVDRNRAQTRGIRTSTRRLDLKSMDDGWMLYGVRHFVMNLDLEDAPDSRWRHILVPNRERLATGICVDLDHALLDGIEVL